MLTSCNAIARHSSGSTVPEKQLIVTKSKQEQPQHSGDRLKTRDFIKVAFASKMVPECRIV